MEVDPIFQENLEPDASDKQSESLSLPAKNSSLMVVYPFATVSLSLSSFISTNFFLPPKYSSIFSPPPNKVKVPSQISALSQLQISTSKPLFRSKPLSSNPLYNPISFGPRRNYDPSSAAGIRRASIVWFRSDLRVQDNECLNSANEESSSVLPVYCFDPRDYGKSSSGFDKTGPSRATFLIESVSNLRSNLQGKGSDLVVRIGKPEEVLVELVREVGADAVYAHKEVSHEEFKMEENIEATLKDEGVEVKYFWGSTLYHLDDLPFKLEEMPSNYGGFRKKVEKLDVRKTISALDQLRGLPSSGNVEPGDVPSLLELGLNPNVPAMQDGKAPASNTMIGGETEGLQKLRKFAAECQVQPSQGGAKCQDSIYGANFSCKISPWLTVGCLSPRMMFEELRKTASSVVSSQKDDGSNASDTRMNWLMYELLWRDFFRFITKKYSSVKKQASATPLTACAGAVA